MKSEYDIIEEEYQKRANELLLEARHEAKKWRDVANDCKWPKPRLPWEGQDNPTLSIECRVSESYDEDYICDIKRPDGSIVSVLIPKENSGSHAAKVVADNDHDEPFGLNLVIDGHYE